MKKSRPPRRLPAALAQRAVLVKDAHAHLSAVIPGFRALPIRQQGLAVQHHVNLRLGTVT